MSDTQLLLTAVGLLLCTALLAVVLRAQRPELAMALSLLAAVLVAVAVLGRLTPLITSLRRMATLGVVSDSGLAVVLKGAGVCLITQLAADTCRDAGDSALAAKAELTGRVLLLLMAVPLYEQILTLVMEVVQGQVVTG